MDAKQSESDQASSGRAYSAPSIAGTLPEPLNALEEAHEEEHQRRIGVAELRRGTALGPIDVESTVRS
jgi:hypothetical protein